MLAIGLLGMGIYRRKTAQ
ncbi:hypothetical protein [Nitrosomonas nitrosa]